MAEASWHQVTTGGKVGMVILKGNRVREIIRIV